MGEVERVKVLEAGGSFSGINDGLRWLGSSMCLFMPGLWPFPSSCGGLTGEAFANAALARLLIGAFRFALDTVAARTTRTRRILGPVLAARVNLLMSEEKVAAVKALWTGRTLELAQVLVWHESVAAAARVGRLT